MALIIISRCDFTISDLDLCVAGCEIVVSFPKICLIVDVFRFATTIDFGMGGKRITQKAVASSDGSAIVTVAPMATGKQVFLGAIITTPTVMQSMTSEDTTNKKRPTAVKKVRLTPVEKQLLVEGTALIRSGAFWCPDVGREVRPVYKIRWSGAVVGNAVHVNPHSLMLQGDEVNTKSRDGCCRLRLGGSGANVRRKTSFPPCHRHHPHRHALHDDSIPHGSKSGLRP